MLGKTWGSRGTPWRLIAMLDAERTNPNSFWRAYLNALPVVQPSTLWWGASTIAATQSEVLIRQITLHQDKIKDMFDTLYPHLLSRYPDHFRSSKHNLTTFTTQYIRVASRAFDAKIDSRKPRKTWALVPFVDLANHDSSAPFTYGEDLSKEVRTEAQVKFDVTAGFCLTPGSELKINYGKKSSTEFLLVYGFLPRHDFRGDFVSVTLPHSISSVIRAAPENNWRGGFVGTDGQLTEDFLAMYTRIVHKAKTGGVEGADSAEAYRVALRLVYTAAVSAQTSLPTTQEQDEADWGRMSGWGSRAQEARTVLEVRWRFKRVLSTLIASLQHRIEAVDPTTNSSWPFARQPGSAVYDSSIVSFRRLQRVVDKSLFTVALPSL